MELCHAICSELCNVSENVSSVFFIIVSYRKNVRDLYYFTERIVPIENELLRNVLKKKLAYHCIVAMVWEKYFNLFLSGSIIYRSIWKCAKIYFPDIRWVCATLWMLFGVDYRKNNLLRVNSSKWNVVCDANILKCNYHFLNTW